MNIHDEALSRVTGYVDERVERQRIADIFQQLPSEDDSLKNAESHLRDLIATSTDVPKMHAAAVAIQEAQQDSFAWNLLRAKVGSYRDNLRNVNSAGRADITPAITWLREQLTVVTETVSELNDELDGRPATPLNLHASRLDPTSAEVLTDTYTQIRDAYKHLVLQVAKKRDLADAVRTSSYLRDAFDKEQAWIDERRSKRLARQPYRGEAEHHTHVTNTPALPYKRDPREHFPNGHQIEYLQWIVAECEPWLPNPDELEARHDLAHSTLRQAMTLQHLDTMRINLATYRGEDEPPRLFTDTKRQRMHILKA
ncbi:hypothetical protein MN032_15675 [Agromyces atrinae]|uniref:hypothetical protein n=1 Tax=Agromyces atrinae TaxID=592376 RepID=UPI001F578764|nr:hypothetical protein [Agromyces atrinae]MCI2959130.1 hypothetical protein [Agromyces atrinae]